MITSGECCATNSSMSISPLLTLVTCAEATANPSCSSATLSTSIVSWLELSTATDGTVFGMLPRSPRNSNRARGEYKQSSLDPPPPAPRFRPQGGEDAGSPGLSPLQTAARRLGASAGGLVPVPLRRDPRGAAGPGCGRGRRPLLLVRGPSGGGRGRLLVLRRRFHGPRAGREHPLPSLLRPRFEPVALLLRVRRSRRSRGGRWVRGRDRPPLPGLRRRAAAREPDAGRDGPVGARVRRCGRALARRGGLPGPLGASASVAGRRSRRGGGPGASSAAGDRPVPPLPGLLRDDEPQELRAQERRPRRSVPRSRDLVRRFGARGGPALDPRGRRDRRGGSRPGGGAGDGLGRAVPRRAQGPGRDTVLPFGPRLAGGRRSPVRHHPPSSEKESLGKMPDLGVAGASAGERF